MNPKSLLITVLLCLILALSLLGCVSSLPTTTTAPSAPATTKEALATGEPAASEPAADATNAVTPTAQLEATSEVTLTEEAATTEPMTVTAVVTTSTAGQASEQGVLPEKARDLAIAYLAAGYKVNLGDPASFAPADLTLETAGSKVRTSYASGPWQIFVLEPQDAGGRIVTPVVLSNSENDTRWWGEVGNDELVTTTVAARMPRPWSNDVAGWVGTIVKLPSGSPYDDYFEGLKGNRFGIDSADANVMTQLEGLGNYTGRVKVSGELQYALPDYDGRRLMVSRIELLDTPSSEQPASQSDVPQSDAPAPVAATPATQAGIADDSGASGASGALTGPLPGAALTRTVEVVGEAVGLFENKVVVQVETEDGTVIGKGVLVTDAADMGQSGHFSGQVLFDNPAAAGKGRVAIYAESPADGSLNLLSWVNIKLAGPAADASATITEPVAGAKVKRTVSVKGIATGVGGQPLLVRVEDLAGTVFGQKRVKLVGDAGETDTWAVEFGVRVPRTARPGRIVVYATTAGGDLSPLASVNVDLTR